MSHSKKLGELLGGIDLLNAVESYDLDISLSSVTTDSRKVKPGGMFIACRGVELDGHHYIDQAIKNGARIVFCEELPERHDSNVLFFLVKDSQSISRVILKRFYDFPDKKLKLVAVTGTNGKTTIAYMLYQLLGAVTETGLIGTLMYAYKKREFPSMNTTPSFESLMILLHEMVDAGVKYCFLEVSSHSLDQERFADLCLEVAVFTQISQDHLDYHKNLEDYFLAKKKLFSKSFETKFLLINRDCPYGERILKENPSAKKYSLQLEADYRAEVIEENLSGSKFRYFAKKQEKDFFIPIPLRHNISNALVVLGVVDLLGFDISDQMNSFASFHGIPGRMESVAVEDEVYCFVDYAHTPDAVEKVLSAVKKLTVGRVLTVLGCGGDRDKTKRPLMAKYGSENSDILILTSDNPRSENPQSILDDMKKGIETSDIEVIEEVDRKKAIFKALAIATPNDVVMVLGKGHENYQQIGNERMPFDDVLIAREYKEMKSEI